MAFGIFKYKLKGLGFRQSSLECNTAARAQACYDALQLANQYQFGMSKSSQEARLLIIDTARGLFEELGLSFAGVEL